jgi:hypothetical protein
MNEMNAQWKGFFKADGFAALILLVYSLVTMVILATIGGQPENAQAAFDMLAQNRLAGILRLDVLSVFIIPLYYLLFLGFFIVLKKTHIAPIAVAAVLGCAGLTLFLATPSVFSWLALSDRFAAAVSEGEKTMLLAAGEAILASDMWHGTGPLVGGLLLQTGMLLASISMLPGNVFGKATAWVGIVTHGLDLLHIVIGFFLPTVGITLMFVAGPLYLVWFPLLAWDFFRLGKVYELARGA